MGKADVAGSGLCGWGGWHAAVHEAQDTVARMGKSLTRVGEAELSLHARSGQGLAVMGSCASRQFHAAQGLAVAVCGVPRFKQARWRAQAARDGVPRTIAACWRAHGDALCAELLGEFSIGIVDETSGDVFLAVDRMASRPLYYQLIGNVLVFGSSTTAVTCHPLAPCDISAQSLYDYVYFHMVPGPDTIYVGQQRLLPGQSLLLRGGKLTVSRYWTMQFDEQCRPPFEDLKQEFLALLRSSVAESVASGKTGAFLSGGTDSSTIAAMLSKAGAGPAQTYSIGFAADGYDEMDYARLAARHFSTQHHEYYVTPDDVVNAIPQIAAVFDQPFGNASAVPAFYCARMAREDGVTRMLGGDGGDELFGGNERYAKQYLFSLYERIPVPLRAAVVEPIAFGMPGGQRLPLLRKARSYIEQASIPMPARLETYNLLEHYGSERVFAPHFLRTVDACHPLDSLNDTYRRAHAQSLINRMLALDLKVTLADNDLPKVVKACELAGMNVAFPFLDDELVAFSARLAPEWKLRGTKLRYFFKEALRDVLPEEIIKKKKHGFGLPFGVWLQTHKGLQALAMDSLSDLKARDIFQSAFIDELLDRRLRDHAGYHGTMVWVLMMLEQWFKQHPRRQ